MSDRISVQWREERTWEDSSESVLIVAETSASGWLFWEISSEDPCQIAIPSSPTLVAKAEQELRSGHRETRSDRPSALAKPSANLPPRLPVEGLMMYGIAPEKAGRQEGQEADSRSPTEPAYRPRGEGPRPAIRWISSGIGKSSDPAKQDLRAEGGP